MDLRTITNEIYAGKDMEKKEKIDELYYSMAEYIKKWQPDAYKQFCESAEDIMYAISQEEAETIVNKMRPHGQVKTFKEITSHFEGKGITDRMIDYYLATNMAWNDFHRTALAHNANQDDFYYDIAFDFVNDPDGGKHKVAKYFSFEQA